MFIAGFDVFSLRIEYCEDLAVPCLVESQGDAGLPLDQPIEEYNGIYSNKCSKIFDDCIKDHS